MRLRDLYDDYAPAPKRGVRKMRRPKPGSAEQREAREARTRAERRFIREGKGHH